MSKELDAWEKIKLGYICCQGAINEFTLRESERENFNLIETALKEGEEAKKKNQIIRTRFGELDNKCCALLLEREANEKKLKALDIIKEKQVDAGRIILIINTWFDDDFALHRYNDYLENDLDKWKLTKEEFVLLKEVLSND